MKMWERMFLDGIRTYLVMLLFSLENKNADDWALNI
jgi:hypothetical protein